VEARPELASLEGDWLRPLYAIEGAAVAAGDSVCSRCDDGPGCSAVGGIVSLVIGVVLLPFSVIGLVFLIGILGFTPLFTSIVYLRNSARMFKTAQPYFRPSSLISAFVFAAAFSAAIPILANANFHPFGEAARIAWGRF